MNRLEATFIIVYRYSNIIVGNYRILQLWRQNSCSYFGANSKQADYSRNCQFRSKSIGFCCYPASPQFKPRRLQALPPHHLVHDAGVALDDLDHLGGHGLVGVGGDGRLGQRPLRVELDGGVDGLEQAALADAGQREAGLVQRLGALGGGSDAHRRERAVDAREEAGLFGQGAGVGDNREGVHLQAVVVVEAHGLVHAHARVELEARGLQALAGARVAGVQDRHVILLGERVDGGEQAREVGLGVDVLLAVCREQHVALGLKAELGQDVRRLDLLQVGAQDLRHGRAGDVGALRGAAGILEVAPCVLGVGQVDVGDHVDDAAVGLLGQALVLAAVARLHVEDGDVEPLGRDGGQAAVGVAEDEEGVRLRLHHELVGGGDDVAHGLAQVGAHGVKVDVGVVKRQVAEEDAVQGVVVVLPGVRQQAVEVAAALLDDLGQADDLRARAHDDQQLKAAIVLEGKFIRHIMIFGQHRIPHFSN